MSRWPMPPVRWRKRLSAWPTGLSQSLCRGARPQACPSFVSRPSLLENPKAIQKKSGGFPGKSARRVDFSASTLKKSGSSVDFSAPLPWQRQRPASFPSGVAQPGFQGFPRLSPKTSVTGRNEAEREESHLETHSHYRMRSPKTMKNTAGVAKRRDAPPAFSRYRLQAAGRHIDEPPSLVFSFFVVTLQVRNGARRRIATA